MNEKLTIAATWLLDRLSENSTWRGITLLLTAIGITLDPDQAAAITAAGLAIVGAINVLRKAKPPTQDQPPVTNYRNLLMLLMLAPLVLATGCARFGTKQMDLSYGDNGQPQRKITTHASAYTFFSAKSSLATWKASQTDKTQGATVGQLDQNGGQTNQLSDILGAVMAAAVKAAAK